ncbi:hypothetical protein PIB30_090807 [Stylosanthes scabra]|uniref:Transposase n=1 Tax=Stylosanthes scabra TaxID=79078 RepID=A0ABU6ZT15_9FABA|nr:hypothetical protein [Stylosanthes scabra]
MSLVPRKLDPLEIFNVIANDELRYTGFHVAQGTDNNESLSDEKCVSCGLRKPRQYDRSKSYTKLAWARDTRDRMRLNAQEDVRRYVRTHIFCLLGSLIFPDKSTTYVSGKFV